MAQSSNGTNNGTVAIDASGVEGRGTANHTIQKTNDYIEAGCNAIEDASKPVKEAVEAARHRIGERAEAGREAVASAAAKTQDALRATRDTAQQYASSVRATADQCVETGQRVISDARSSAASHQQAASEMVHSTVAQGKQRVDDAVGAARDITSGTTKRIDEARTTICQRATEYVDAGKGKVDYVRTTVGPVLEEGKVRAVSISSNGKRAITTRDFHLFITTMAQIAALLFLIINAVVAQICRCDRVASVIKRTREISVVKYLETAVRRGDAGKLIEKVPKIGPKVLHWIRAFIMEVKKNV